MKYISAADTAKLVRKALKVAFPSVKFSVRSKTYSGGASIDVSWLDGPTAKEVESVAKTYEGSGFDGSIDLAYSHHHYQLPDGSIIYGGTTGTENSMGVVPSTKTVNVPEGAEPVHFLADYVFCQRKLSAELLMRASREVCAKFGQPLLPIKSNGDYAWIAADGPWIGPAYLSQMVYHEAEEMKGDAAIPAA